MQTPDRETIRQWIDEELDGALPPARVHRLRQLLAEDPEWRRERQALARVHERLRQDEVRVRPGFRDEVLAGLPPAPWESRQPRALALAAALVVALLGGAVALLAWGGDGPGPVLGTLLAVADLFRASLMAGAGLLAASWRGVGMALSELLASSPATLVALGVVVVTLNLLLYRLLRRRRPAAETVSRPSRERE